VLWNVDARGIATVTLNRPEVNNAYNGELIQGLLSALDALGNAKGLRAAIIRGNGRHFQAGADLKWIDAVRMSSAEENIRVSRATAEAVQRLNLAPVPTVALVQGGCFGGGTGLAAACDVVIAADNATFSIAEVRWGLTAAIIVPQLNDAIGVRQMRRYALTGERFGADEARRIGLVHEVVPLAELAAAGDRVIGHILENQGADLAIGVRQSHRRSVRAADREPCGEAAIVRGPGGSRLVRGKARGELDAEKALIDNNTGLFDHLAPATGFVLDEGPRHLRRAANRLDADIAELLLHVRHL
jgi:methylglutaconyl-CoA hydratase